MRFRLVLANILFCVLPYLLLTGIVFAASPGAEVEAADDFGGEDFDFLFDESFAEGDLESLFAEPEAPETEEATEMYDVAEDVPMAVEEEPEVDVDIAPMAPMPAVAVPTVRKGASQDEIIARLEDQIERLQKRLDRFEIRQSRRERRKERQEQPDVGSDIAF